MSEYGWRIATSMEDLEIGQVIASYSTMMTSEELVRAGRIVEFVGGPNAVVDNEVGETKRIGFHNGNTVFILADAPVDPAEAAWEEWQPKPDRHWTVAHEAFIAGWKAKEES